MLYDLGKRCCCGSGECVLEFPQEKLGGKMSGVLRDWLSRPRYQTRTNSTVVEVIMSCLGGIMNEIPLRVFN
jgi:hypothetical protein